MDPKTLKFTPTHEWVHLDGDVATVGISRFAVDQLTDLIMIELPKVGTRVAPGKSFGEVESVKAVSDLYAPVGGEVVEVNSAVADDVQVLAEDPYEKGWLIKVRVDDPAPVAAMLDHDAYQNKVADEAH
jgi:glycine cleavage system H protein